VSNEYIVYRRPSLRGQAIRIGAPVACREHAEQRTIMYQNAAGKHIASWYVNDRRYALTLRASF